MKKLLTFASASLFAVTAQAGIVTWNFEIQIAANNTGLVESAVITVHPCSTISGFATYSEATRAHEIAQLLDADITFCGQSYTEANLFGSYNLIGTTNPPNMFNTMQSGFTVSVYEQDGTTFSEIAATYVGAGNFWKQLGTGTYTRVGDPVNDVPVPASAALLGLGLLGFRAAKRSKTA
jgi:hypothetical protein